VVELDRPGVLGACTPSGMRNLIEGMRERIDEIRRFSNLFRQRTRLSIDATSREGVAEWFKAAVLKFTFGHAAPFLPVPSSQCFRA
jgi:hypothetical protein